jgi:ligand-binding sensor domain-containing protein
MTKLIQSLKANKRNITIAVVGLAILIFAATAFYIYKFNKRLAEDREQIAAAARIEVQETQLRAPATDGFTAFLNSSDVRATAKLLNLNYLATSGGLFALDENGNVKRRYTTLDGLTDNDLTTLAVFNNQLFIGTATSGMMSFDGNSFTGYRFVKPKATRVSAMLATETELLIGTLDGGLFEYDGKKFVRRLNSATGADFSRVTALLANNSRIYIGTQDKGVYLWREAQFQHFAESEGLPSQRVTGLAVMPKENAIAIATDFGVVALNEANEIKEISKQPNITSLAASGGRLWAGLFSGGIVEINNDATSNVQTVASSGQKATDSGLPKTISTNVYAADGKLFALTTEGAFERDERAASLAFAAVSNAITNDHTLTNAHITSLAMDDSANIWIGFFDRGVDIFAPDSKERLSHIEDDRVREVNFIAIGKGDDRALIATSRGLVQVDSRLKQTVLTKEQGGLIDNAVAHICFVNDSSTAAPNSKRIALATAGGLTDITNNRARSLTAFHGLSSNHLYTVAGVGSHLFVGSLAGLVELEGLRVIRTYKKSNSKLSDDWVTALIEAEGTLFIGTNGGGVDALLPTGEWLNFADEMGKFEVNQNAMYFDGEKLYVGTSDKGLLVYNTRERRWTTISAGLTSQNVTSITADDRYIYVGTLNGLTRIEKRVV